MPNNKVRMTNETPVFAVRVRLINTERLLRHQILEQFDPFAIIQRLQQALGHEGVGRRFGFSDFAFGDCHAFSQGANGNRRVGFFFDQACDDSSFGRHDDPSLEVATDDGIGIDYVFDKTVNAFGSGTCQFWGRASLCWFGR